MRIIGGSWCFPSLQSRPVVQWIFAKKWQLDGYLPVFYVRQKYFEIKINAKFLMNVTGGTISSTVPYIVYNLHEVHENSYGKHVCMQGCIKLH